MGISIFPSQGNGFTLQRVITTTGEYSLGTPRECYVLLAGGGGAGGGVSAGSSRGGGGGGGGGAFGLTTFLNEFHATIGAGGTAASATAGAAGGTTALTISGGNEGVQVEYAVPNRISKQIVARGGGGGSTQGGGETASSNLAAVSGITNRTALWQYGSVGGSGAAQGGSTAPTSQSWRTSATTGGWYNSSGMIHNNSGNYGQANAGGPTSQVYKNQDFNSFISRTTQNAIMRATATTFESQLVNMTADSGYTGIGAAPGGQGYHASYGASAYNGGGGLLTGGGGGGGYSNTGGSAAGGGTSLYGGGLGLSGGGGGGGGAGIFGAGSNGTFTSTAAGGTGGAGGLGGGGGGGAGGGTSSATTGGNGGAGIMLIFY